MQNLAQSYGALPAIRDRTCQCYLPPDR